MKYREFGRTGWKVSEIGFGTWAIGSSWGPVEESDSFAALNRAVDLGVNFFDTAAAYTDSLAKWLNTLCARMSVSIPGRNEQDRARLEAILNSGQDRALLKLLREQTQLLVLMVRVSQQTKKDEAAARAAEEDMPGLGQPLEPDPETETESDIEQGELFQ